jgi:hypothetical protein
MRGFPIQPVGQCDDMTELRNELADILERMDVTPTDPEVDSGLRLIKAFLRIHDAKKRAALVALAESLRS